MGLRSVRALRTCGLLLANGGLSFSYLLSLLDVTRRTVFRYIADMRRAGFIVEIDKELGVYRARFGPRLYVAPEPTEPAAVQGEE